MNSLKTTLLYFFLACSLITILILFIMLPTVASIKENKKNLTAKQTEFVNNEEKVAVLRNFQKNQDELKTRIDRINNLWPTNSEVSSFIVNLENIAAAQDTTLKNIAMSEPKAVVDNKKDSKGGKKKMSAQFSFDTQANFNQNLMIVKSMETLSRFNSIKQVNLTRGDEGIVFMKITGNVYYGE